METSNIKNTIATAWSNLKAELRSTLEDGLEMAWNFHKKHLKVALVIDAVIFCWLIVKLMHLLEAFANFVNYVYWGI